MSKDKDRRTAVTPSEISPTSANGSNGQRSTEARSPERQALAAAIALRNEAAEREATLKQAADRAKADGFRARRAVEVAEAALNTAQETARFALADAYLEGEADDGSAVTEAEAALAAAQRRAAELAMIEQELSARSGPAPGHSVPNMKVSEAARNVVRAHPAVRRLAQDFGIAKRAFQQYEATLIHLASRRCIPDDLISVAPSANATRYADPADEWVKAIAALAQDADAELPA
jgi:hypothetical protein